MEDFDPLDCPPNSTDAIDEVENKGWASLSWSETRSLHDLASLVFSEASEHCIYSLGSAMRLTATIPEKARNGGKSSLRGLGAFPPHTDQAWLPMPPRYILLRSISGRSESPTDILHFEVNNVDDRLHSNLASGLWAYRGAGASQIRSVLDGDRIRWDEDCMRPLDGLAKRTHFEFIEWLNSAPKISYHWYDRSSVLLINNWNTLHARAPVNASEHREIERLYVEII